MAESAQSKADVVAEILKFLKGKLDGSDEAELRRILFDPGELRDYVDEDLAKDAAIGRGNPIRAVQAYRQAETECAAYLDGRMAFDNASQVYGHALKQMGADIRGVPAATLPGFFRAMRQLSAGGGRLAADSASNQAVRDKFLKDFPGAVIPRVAA